MGKSKKLSGVLFFLILCCLFAGCAGQEEEEKEQKDKTISEIQIPGLLEHCIDESGEHYYYTVSGESAIYQCSMDGRQLARFEVTADDGEENTQGFLGEQPPEASDLNGLCIYGDTLYCYRNLKSTLMAIDITTGESRLLTKMKTSGVNKMAAGANSVMLLTFGDTGKILYVYHTDTKASEQVPVKRPQMFAHAGEDIYWINVLTEAGTYGFQKYQADTGELSEVYDSNFTYEVTELAYDKTAGLMYGRMYSLQYLCFDPENPKNVSRFTAQEIKGSPSCFQVAGGRLYTQDREKETVYHFDPTAFVTQNRPLKGYVTSEFAVTEWAGYNIDLEVISWEELALKVLAEDRDYDFVIMTTDMPEATALRDAMAYLPIPEDVLENYWEECWPCVREGATYNEDIWMLPLEIYARGLVYSEKNLEKYGLSIENMKTMKDLCEAAKRLYAGGETGWYGLNQLQTPLLQEYLWKAQKEETINFDTPEFRAIMEFIREEYKDNGDSSGHYRNSYINLNTWGMVYDETSGLTYEEQQKAELRKQAAKVYLEEVDGYSWAYEKYIGAENIRVCPVPGMFGMEETVQVNGTFLVLNPNSKNKEELFDFTAAMAETYIANPETYLSSNAERYPQDIVVWDVCELYRKGEMAFGLPEDLFTSYYLYVVGQIHDEEEVIKELNRVVNMYYGE